MHTINVSLVFATRDHQWLFESSVKRGTNVFELIEMSDFLELIDVLKEQALTDLSLGIYSAKVSGEHLLEEGDRVEIYRPLTADPREVRRQLALLGKTMGKN